MYTLFRFLLTITGSQCPKLQVWICDAYWITPFTPRAPKRTRQAKRQNNSVRPQDEQVPPQDEQVPHRHRGYTISKQQRYYTILY